MALSDTPSLRTVSLMELQPLYDIEAKEWIAEIGGKTYAASTLRLLQRQLPGVQFLGYYPEGFIAVREGFLQTSDRKPLILPKHKQHEPRETRPTTTPIAKPVVVVAPPKATYDAIMDLVVEGKRSPTIARALRCPLATVQLYRIEAYRKKDPRIRPRPKRFVRPSGPPVRYSAADDTQLRELAGHGLRSWEIAEIMHRTANSIVGRCHRIGAQLLWDKTRCGPKFTEAEHAA